MQDEVLVTILTYNEENKISDVLKDVCDKFKNVLVVDNSSEDLTVEKVKKFPVYLIKHKYNLGKSNSMKTALKLAKIRSIKEITPKSGTNFWTEGSKIKNPKVIQIGRREVRVGSW